MTFTTQQIRSAYKNLSEDAQELVGSNEATELVINTLKESRLNDGQFDLADSEILYSLYGLQSLDDAINNIAKITNKTPADFSKLKLTVQNEILSKYKIDNKEFVASNNSTALSTPDTKEVVKEDLIRKREMATGAPSMSVSLPEIAPEIHPVVEVAKSATPSSPVMILKKEDKPTLSSSALAATAPKPVEQKPTQPNVALPDYRYDGGKDPYREPLK